VIDLNDSPAIRRGEAASTGSTSTGSTLRRLAAGTIAAGLFSLGVVPAAFAQGIPFTDPDGNTCTTDQTVAGPNGETLCPQSVGKGGSKNNPSDPRLAYKRAVVKLYGPNSPQALMDPPTDEEFEEFEHERDVNGWIDAFSHFDSGGSSSTSGSPAHLGLYTSPNGGIGGLQGDGFSVSGSGSAITDSSGAFGGTKTPGFTGSGVGGGIYGAIDPMPNLELGGRFDYQHVNIGFGGAGSEQADDYTFAGYIKYYRQDSYARASLSYSFGPAKTFNAATSATGSFNTTGLNGDVGAGHVFTLVDPISGAASGRIGRYALLLDLGGHGGYDSVLSDGSIDSAGFALGTERYQYGDVGAKAKLEAVVPTAGIVWLPYIEATLDQHLGTIDQLNVPEQAGVTVADLVKYSDANTFWGGRIGLSTRMRAGLSLGVNGFVSASSDLTIVGGEVFIKKQF
jgi:hypothetical protein